MPPLLLFFPIFLMGLLGGSAAAATQALAPGETVAFLGIHFIDTSTEGAYFGEKPDEKARVKLIEDTVRKRCINEGLVLLDLAPVAKDLDRIVNPADCYGCEVRMGQKLGADYVLAGEIQKVSNLILSMNLVLRDSEDGRVVRALAVDIRSNTDKSWLRGIRYILNKAIFKE